MSQILVTGEAKIRDIQGPVVANSGVITALDGAANQYVRGDGTLASFPTSGGGGSSVSYYLNGSVNQGTFGGSTYYQMSKNAIVGTGTNFSASANGLIAQFITDANDPDVVSIPSGNWNLEFFMNVSASSGALASFYVEFYKYNGSTFTLLATNVATPEQLTNTTTVDAYYTSVAMPLSSMAVTDRLAIRIFVNVAGKTVTLYTEDNRLCQVVTTFSKGLASLNNLTDQSQYLTTGTSGTNFNIVSSGDTHTFNLPVASATNTGKLSNTDWSTFNNKVPYTGATGNVDLGTFNLSTLGTLQSKYVYIIGNGTNSGFLSFSQYATPDLSGTNTNSIYTTSNNKVNFRFWQSGLSWKNFNFDVTSLTAGSDRTYTLPDLSGTLALLEGSQTFTGLKTFSNNVNINQQLFINGGTGYGGGISYRQGGILSTSDGSTTTEFPDANSIKYYVGQGSNTYKNFVFDVNNITLNATRTYSLPDASGTIALTSDLSAYVTLATTQTISGAKTFSAATVFSSTTSHTGTATFGAGSPTAFDGTDGTLIIPKIRLYSSNPASIYSDFVSAATSNRSIVVPDASGTLALTSNLSAYLPLSGGTLTGALGGTSATFSSTTTATAFIPTGSTIPTNGMYRSAANTLNFATNSTNRFSIASDGVATFGTDLYVGRNIYVTDVEAGVYADFHGRNSTGTSVPLTFLYGSAGDVIWNNGGTKMTLTSAGALQVVSNLTAAQATFTSATNPLIIRGTNASTQWTEYYYNTSTLLGYIGNGSGILTGGLSSDFIFRSETNFVVATGGNNRRMTITSGGNVGIGTPSPSTIISGARVLQVDGSAYGFILASSGSVVAQMIGDSNGGQVAFGSRSNHSMTLTTNDIERMRITSVGAVYINGTTADIWNVSSGTIGQISLNTAFPMAIAKNDNLLAIFNRIGTTGDILEFKYNASVKGSISTNGTNVSYNTSSDYRLKEDLKEIEGLEKVSEIKVYDFKWKDSEDRMDGVIAHELEQIIPYAVNGVKDAVDNKGNIKPQSVDYSKLVPILIKSIQELQAKIVTLESKIN